MITVLCFFMLIVFVLLLDIFSKVKETRIYVQSIVHNKEDKEKALHREGERKEKIDARLQEILLNTNTQGIDRRFEDVAFDALFETYSWTTKDEWIYTLITQYPNYVVKEYGRRLQEVRNELSWLWTSYYKDEIGFEYKFCEWAKMFNNKPAIQVYLQMLYDKNITNENVISLVSDRQRNLYNAEDEENY